MGEETEVIRGGLWLALLTFMANDATSLHSSSPNLDPLGCPGGSLPHLRGRHSHMIRLHMILFHALQHRRVQAWKQSPTPGNTGVKGALGQDQPGIQPLNAPLQSWSQSRWGLPILRVGESCKEDREPGTEASRVCHEFTKGKTLYT